jgi:FdrA protein
VIDHVELRTGAYADSVTLMQVSQRLQRAEGVAAALVAMATPLNVELARGMGFAAPDGASSDALLVALRVTDEAGLRAALAAAEQALAPQPATPASTDQPAPRTVGSAARHEPGLALISVPGQHAFTEAIDALDAGCDVMIFSDNVPIAHEIVLKRMAAELGRLVMGPDCGTAVIGGIGLGFANAVRPGPVGIVAASGTGCQQLLCLLDAAEVGISAALGVGGRDLSAAVGGRSTLTAVQRLDADSATELIVVVSKLPDAQVARQIRDTTTSTPVRFAFIGETDLSAAAADVVQALGRPAPAWPAWPALPGRATDPRPGVLRGLFAGGTLCDEATLIAHERRVSHEMIDFGDDALTAGRPHPMIDSSLRVERLAGATADPDTAAILLDVLLGHGAQPDPAAELAPLIAASRAPVVASLIGTRDDPQDLGRQASTLRHAGAHVFASNAQAARFACGLVVHD